MATKEELDKIIDETILFSDGSFNMAWGEGYDDLTIEEQQIVEDAVYEEIYNCDGCGWYFNVNNLETVSNGETMCCGCASNFEEEEDESDEN